MMVCVVGPLMGVYFDRAPMRFHNIGSRLIGLVEYNDHRPITHGHSRLIGPVGLNGQMQHDPSPDFGDVSPSFGPHAPTQPNWSVLNCVELGVPPDHDRNRGGPSSDVVGPSIPWQTKPRAHVYTGSDSCIGLPRIPDLHASDVSAFTGSHINATQYGSNCDGTDSYIPMPVGNTSWYPDLGASHHVCRDASTLHDSTPYSSCNRPFFVQAQTKPNKNKNYKSI
ncbi:hypothetical protein ES332_A04G138600v1 [Gossypium tomentosum]|uniref:Uncharacterized protein n=1 Tax=Gossypium tomentosum TaxID=34277 RepID=A0A5D2R168_GOSTO|nr:hypothetical protein ES332_A04G138600v1 [Gossypium tomentosum]